MLTGGGTPFMATTITSSAFYGQYMLQNDSCAKKFKMPKKTIVKRQ
jgi:hypothetical protein